MLVRSLHRRVLRPFIEAALNLAKLSCALFCLFLLCPQTVFAQCDAVSGRCLYVSPSGEDELTPASNCYQPGLVDCSKGGGLTDPWKSLQKAAHCVQPGDIVYVRGGNYPPACTQGPGAISYGSTRSGEMGKVITLKAYPGETPVLNGQILLNVAKGDYHVVEGLEVVGAPVKVEGVGIGTWGSHVVIRNNHVHHVDFGCGSNLGGIKVYNEVTDVTIEGNVIHDNFDRSYGDHYSDVNDAGSFLCAGIKLMHHPSNIVVRKNIIYNQPAGMQLKYPEGQNNLIEDNLFYDSIYGVYASNNGYTFRSNTVHHTSVGLWIGGGEAGVIGGFDVTVTGNTFAANGSAMRLLSGNPKVTDNIFYNPASSSQISVYDGAYNDNMGYPNQDLTSLMLNHNCFFSDSDVYKYEHSSIGPTFTLAQVQATFSQEQDSIFADPLFANADANDYELKAGSPCTGFGDDGTTGLPGTGGGDAGGGGPDGGGPDGGGMSPTGSSSGGATGASMGGGGLPGDGGSGGAGAAADGGCACQLGLVQASRAGWATLLLALIGVRRRGARQRR